VWYDKGPRAPSMICETSGECDVEVESRVRQDEGFCGHSFESE